ncbi:MAG TPA: NBR1-Ig-like domain-containing protein [Anaerolineales bacterium]
MYQSTKRVLFILMAGITLLAACAPAPAPTQDPAEAQRQIQEAVALTVSAQNAQTEQALALIPEPTNTPLPTQTEAVPPTPTSLLPTATPFVVVPPTLTPAPNTGISGGNAAPVVQEYACNVINQQPTDNSIWKQKKDFDVNWTIVNTGTKAWRDGLDLVFYSGTNFATTSAVELPAMAPGDQYKVVLDAVTPSKDGSYVMVWKLEGGFCFPYIAINVEQ